MNPMSQFVAQHTSSSLSSAFSQHGASDEESPVKSGTLLIAGCIDFEHATAKAPEGLPSHTVIDCGAPVRRTFSSSSALHFFVQLEDNRILAMGINANGQLGLNDTSNRTFPMPVRMPVSAEVVKIACGRFHSLFLFSNGEVYGCGANKVGQLGVGEGKVASADFKSLVKVPIRDVVDIDAGYEFSIACDKNGRLWTWGSPQNGQLGHGTTGEYLKEGGKGKALQFQNVTSPKQVTKFLSKDNKGKVVDTIEASQIRIGMVCAEEWRRAEEDSQNRVFSWGTGGYGRLGHNSPDEELYPREIIHFGATMVGGTFKLNPQRQIRTLAAGSTFTLGVSKSGCLYYWGKMSNSSRGESTMYPKQVMELCSYKCDKVACGNNLVVVTADDCVAGWGVPTSGLLGFEGNVKSTIPPKLILMEGANVLHLSCGYAHVCFVVEPTNDAYKETLASLPRLENTQSSVEAGASAPEGKKRAAKEEGEAGAKKKTTKK